MGVAGTILSSGREGVIIAECIVWDELWEEGCCIELGVPDRESERTRRRSTICQYNYGKVILDARCLP